MTGMRRICALVLCLCMLGGTGRILAEAKTPLRVENGMLQPVFTVTDMRSGDYTNEGSDILRFCVWVETDYDTDGDGKADLVKAFLQVPRAAAEGQYKAATIYDPTPYAAGTVNEYEEGAEPMYVEKPFDYARLEEPGEKRVPEGGVTTLEAAARADSEQWNYLVPKSGAVGFNTADNYDYYLARGFAVAVSCGIGTYGSEGFELCGMKQERDSHKNVVEWLAGDRVAFTDRTGRTAIKADWSNGAVAMTGCSYGGTLPFSVAVTGVKGLKTIIPFAGIANWYDYTNSQGVAITNKTYYADSLAVFNCGGTFLDEEWNEPNPEYGSWLWQISRDQEATNGDYGEVYEMLDYTLDQENHVNCSALVVTGMNDQNVTTRHADQMVKTFLKAGKTVKLVLHQDGHNNLDDLNVNGRVWQEIMNEWLSHYLYDVENGAEAFPAVLAQSNVDGSFKAYERWEDPEMLEAKASFTGDTATVTAEGLGQYVMDYQETIQNNLTREDQEAFYRGMPASMAAVYPLEVAAGTTFCGVPEVRVTLRSTGHEEYEGMMITAVLMDVSDKGTFPAYRTHTDSDSLVPIRWTDDTFVNVDPKEPGSMKVFLQEDTAAQCVSFGWTDLDNPGMGPDSYEYVFQEEGREAGKAYEYTFYMQPCVYTLAEGHHLELRLMTWDPFRVFLDESFQLDGSQETELIDYNYSFTVDNTALKVLLPIQKEVPQTR